MNVIGRVDDPPTQLVSAAPRQPIIVTISRTVDLPIMVRHPDYMSPSQLDEDVAPTLGSMFRLIHSSMVREYATWLETTEYHDIRPAHAAVLQPLWQAPQGERLTTLAKTANITKQSMGALVDSLVASGYVERVPDPGDARATRIRLTPRGRRYGRDVRGFGRELETRLAEQLGANRLKNLRSSLDVLWKALQSQA